MTHPPFTALASVYDEIMSDVAYDEWCDFILTEASKRGYSGGPVLDLGCGTGNMTLLLAERGLTVTGLDSSPQMLEVARRKAPAIDWRQGEFTNFELNSSFELIVAVFDSLNNLTEPEQVVATAKRVLAHLRPGGLFLFDVNTHAGLADLWEGGAVTGWAGSVYYRWELTFDPELGLARVEAYCEDGQESFTEVHLERAYGAAELTRLLTEAGLGEVEPLAYPDGGAPRSDEERIWICARAPGR